jgi:hypothetical protein
MDMQTIDTIALTRKIRDNHYQYLRGKTHADRISFYREKAKKMQEKIALLWTPETTAQVAQVQNSEAGR